MRPAVAPRFPRRLTSATPVVLLLAAGMTASARQPDPDRIIYQPDLGEQPYIDFALEPQFAPLVSLQDDAFRLLCSGSSLDATTVLSAAHCWKLLDGFGPFFDRWHADAGSRLMRIEARDHSKLAWVDELIAYPEYWSAPGESFDITILKLAERGMYYTDFATIAQSDPPIGAQIAQVGYGRRASATDPSSGDNRGVLLAATNTFDAFGDQVLLDDVVGPSLSPQIQYDGLRWFYEQLSFGDLVRVPSTGNLYHSTEHVLLHDLDGSADPALNILGSDQRTPLEGGAAGGDSGGPMMWHDGTEWRIVGVSSFTSDNPDTGPGNRGYGTVTANISVATFADWVADHQNEAVWEEGVTGIRGFSDPMNWWNEGERRAPDATRNLVFRLPGTAPFFDFPCNGQITVDRSQVQVTFDADADHRRLRVRRYSDVTLDLQGHTLSLLNQSPSTPALSVGFDQTDWPVLRVVGGTLFATDVAVAETGYSHQDLTRSRPGSTTDVISWTRGEIVVDNADFIVSDAMYLGDRKTHITDSEWYRYRVPAGQGIVRVVNDGLVSIGNRLRLGFAADEHLRVCSQVEFNVLLSSASVVYQLGGELRVEQGAAVVGNAAPGPSGSLVIASDGTVESAGLIAANVISDGRFDVIDKWANYTGRWIGGIFDREFVSEVNIRRGRARVVGDFSQGSDGVLAIDISGTEPYFEHDLLVVSGIFSADGTLEVNFDQGFVPQLGDQFTVVEAASTTGNFAAMSVTGLPAGLHATAEVTGGTVTVTVNATPCTGDIADDFGTVGADGQVSFGDFLALLGLIGPCAGGTPGCVGDLADDFGTLGGDGQVSFGDFLALLGLIGPCP